MKKSILATSITGGSDPERAIVAYFRFEADNFLSGSELTSSKGHADHYELVSVITDVGPYGNHATLLGGSKEVGGMVYLGGDECMSPMEQIRRQTQLPLVFKGAAAAVAALGTSRKAVKEEEKSKEEKE